MFQSWLWDTTRNLRYSYRIIVDCNWFIVNLLKRMRIIYVISKFLDWKLSKTISKIAFFCHGYPERTSKNSKYLWQEHIFSKSKVLLFNLWSQSVLQAKRGTERLLPAGRGSCSWQLAIAYISTSSFCTIMGRCRGKPN